MILLPGLKEEVGTSQNRPNVLTNRYKLANSELEKQIKYGVLPLITFVKPN